MKKRKVNIHLSPANSKPKEREVLFSIKLKESIHKQLEYLSNTAKEQKSVLIRAMIKREYRNAKARERKNEV